jgi:hypothetical protein
VADVRFGLETAIVSPSVDDGLRRFNLSLGLLAGGSSSAFELDLLVVLDDMFDVVALDAGLGGTLLGWPVLWAFPPTRLAK